MCGASGFIGRNIYEHLSLRDDLEVFGTYRTNAFSQDRNLIRADLTDRRDVDAVCRGMDVIIQAAAVTSGSKDIVTKPYIHITDNLIMTSLLCQAAFDHHVKQFIFPSCTVLYPPNTGVGLREIDMDTHAIHEKYFGGAWLKIYLEKLCEFYSRMDRTVFTVIRHSNIYGPYDKYDLERSHVFGATMTKVMRAKDGDTLTVWGDGQETRDLLHVDDMVRFVEMVLNKQDYAFDVFNIGLDKETSIKELAEKIINASGKRLSIAFDATKPTIPTKLFLNSEKAEKKFNWRPSITLEDGIARTIEWYKQNIREL